MAIKDSKKIKVLIFGMSPLVGGVETYVTSILHGIPQEKISVDLLVKERITGNNGANISGYYNRLLIIPRLEKHPFGAIRALKKECKQNSYDILHFNLCTSYLGIYAAIVKFFSPQTKIIFHSHNGNDKRKIRHFLFKPLINIVADKKIACSEVAAKWMFGTKQFEKGEVEILNNFIDTRSFIFNKAKRQRVRKGLGLQDKFVIGHVGRFSPQKNHEKVIEIFNEVHLKNNKTILMLLGTGPLENKIKIMSKKLNLENNILFLGTKNNINDYYQAMDLFILPSLFEGLPIAGIEAQASGLRCLFSDTIDDKSALSNLVQFIPLNDTSQWAKRICDIAKLNYPRKNMQEVIVNSGYDMKTEIKKIESMYNELAK